MKVIKSENDRVQERAFEKANEMAGEVWDMEVGDTHDWWMENSDVYSDMYVQGRETNTLDFLIMACEMCNWLLSSR